MDLALSERLAAIGALYCGETPTLQLLSTATGRTLYGLELAAKRCGWEAKRSEPRKPDNIDKVKELLRRVEHIMDQKLIDCVTTKSDVDEMLNLLKLAEKLSGTVTILSQAITTNAQEPKEGDPSGKTSNIRNILKKIDQRIQDLAERRTKALLNEEKRSV